MSDAVATSSASAKTFPEQDSQYLGKRAEVCFSMHFSNPVFGEIVRSDKNGAVRIIKLDDGNYILGSECQWKPLPKT